MTHRHGDATGLRDSQLMAAVQAESVPAFGELYDRYCDRAYRLAVTICRDGSRAEDAVQAAFLSIWRCRASYREDRGDVGAWLMTIVRNRAIDAVRSHTDHAARVTSAGMLKDVPAADDTAAQAEDRVEARRLQAILALLPDPQREIITLAFYGGLSHTEIAARLSLPDGTVKGRIRLGLQKLRTQLEQTVPDAHRPEQTETSHSRVKDSAWATRGSTTPRGAPRRQRAC